MLAHPFVITMGRPGHSQWLTSQTPEWPGGLGRALGELQAHVLLEGHSPWEIDHEMEIWVQVVYGEVLLRCGGNEESRARLLQQRPREVPSRALELGQPFRDVAI